MSLKYRDVTGEETPIAGLNGLSGELVPSVSYYQTGVATITETIPAYSYKAVDVTLSEMPDKDYCVVFSQHTRANTHADAWGQTAEGFRVYMYNDTNEDMVPSDARTIAVTWRAFKLMTDESRAIDEQAIATNTADIATLKGTLSVTNGTGTRNATYVSSTGFRANWYKYGRIVTLSLQVTASAELAGTELLVTGLPAPITDLTFTGATSAGNANLNAVLTTAGALRPHYSWANGAAFMGTLTYISKE